MAANHRERGGFSLIELVIVLAVIGVLAAIAIPSFLRYQLRSRSAEALLNLKSIATAEETYIAEFGTYVSVSPPVPATAPGNARAPWTSGSRFDVLGWSPEGSVQFQYRVTADGNGSGLTRFTAEARGDLDGDGQPSFWAFVKPGINGGLNGSFSGTTCVGSGVVSGGSATATESPGACDLSSGRSVFQNRLARPSARGGCTSILPVVGRRARRAFLRSSRALFPTRRRALAVASPSARPRRA